MPDTINFGTAAFKGAVTGLIITSIKQGSTAQSAEAMDEEGNIIQVDMYGKKQTVNIEGTVSSGTTLALVAGADLTIGGVTYKIESVDVTSTNTGHTNASITASAPVPVTSSGSGTSE
jgi:hypothetical protein